MPEERGSETTPTVPPGRSLHQRQEALRRANEVRFARARFKRDLSHEAALRALFVPDARLETMKIYDLLLAVPSVGRVKANRILLHAQVSPSKTLGGLTDRQRRELVGELGRIGGCG